jgi:hypothetical protein
VEEQKDETIAEIPEPVSEILPASPDVMSDAAEPLPETFPSKIDPVMVEPVVESESPESEELPIVKTAVLSENIDGFENLSAEQQEALLEYVKVGFESENI